VPSDVSDLIPVSSIIAISTQKDQPALQKFRKLAIGILETERNLIPLIMNLIL
jgi:hypothetical protein